VSEDDGSFGSEYPTTDNPAKIGEYFPDSKTCAAGVVNNNNYCWCDPDTPTSY
jgi:hypothetical protein